MVHNGKIGVTLIYRPVGLSRNVADPMALGEETTWLFASFQHSARQNGLSLQPDLLDCIIKKPLVDSQFHSTSYVFLGSYVVP